MGGRIGTAKCNLQYSRDCVTKIIFLTTYFSFDEVSLKSEVRLAVIIFEYEGHSCRLPTGQDLSRPLEFTFRVMGFSQDLHVKNPRLFRT